MAGFQTDPAAADCADESRPFSIRKEATGSGKNKKEKNPLESCYTDVYYDSSGIYISYLQ